MNTHQAIVKREVYRWIYEVKQLWYNDCYIVTSEKEFIETDWVWDGLLDSPALQEGDELYISETNETITIKKVIRTTQNEFIYFANDKIITDEESKESLAKAELEKEQIKKDLLDKRDVENALKAEKKLNWFQKLFKK